MKRARKASKQARRKIIKPVGLAIRCVTDPESFEGTFYKASGWEAVGQSQGHSRHRTEFYVPNQRPKRLWK